MSDIQTSDALERGHVDVVADLRSQNEALKKELISPILVNLNKLVDGMDDLKAKNARILSILKVIDDAIKIMSE